MPTLFRNARFFTSNLDLPEADSLLEDGGKIVWLGKAADMPPMDAEMVEVVNLAHKTVIPALIDAHMHPFDLALTQRQIAATPPLIRSVEDLCHVIRQARTGMTSADAAREWIVAWGFDEGKVREGRFPTREELDAVSADVPVLIIRACGHMVMLNSTALSRAGVDEQTEVPDGGEIEIGETGRLTGMLRENARFLAHNAMPAMSGEESAGLLALLSDRLLAQGITAVTDMMASMDSLALYERASTMGYRQVTGLYLLWDELRDAKMTTLDAAWLDKDRQVFVAGVKVFADGSISGRTAWVQPPFEGGEDTGMPLTSREELLAAAAFARANGIQLAVHAMGEQAIDLVVDTLWQDANWLADGPSVRVEHLALPTRRAMERAAKGGIAFVVQPIFFYAEIESYLRNLGPSRTDTVYPIASMMRLGVPVSLSSDAPSTAWARPEDPFLAMQAAVTRVAHDGTLVGADENIDIGTAVRLYTRAARRDARMSLVGELRPGNWCDFAVLSEDIFSVSALHIGGVYVERTVLHGETVYERRK